MITESLEKKLEIWKRLLILCVVASVALLATAIADAIPRQGFSYPANWMYAWVIFQVIITPAGFVLLISKGWRQLPLSQRLDTAYGYLAVTWVAVFAFGVESKGDALVLYAVLVVLGVSAIALGLFYWLFRRTHSISPEEMFP